MALFSKEEIQQEMEQRRALEERIDNLSRERAAFCLKALLVARHIYPELMDRTVALAEAIKCEE